MTVLADLAQLVCDEDERRTILATSVLNGVDYIEVPWNDQTHIRVFFVKAPAPVVSLDRVKIRGGVRVTQIEVTAANVRTDPETGLDYLEVTVDQRGDFSVYVLEIDPQVGLDPRFAKRLFSFKAGCPTDLDCRAEQDCPPEALEEPLIDYMAKDYASFRRLLMDLAKTKVPEWVESHEADMGMALIELLAYHGDHLSYYQDAVANEMHLQTARQRESVRRHARLVDYPMHQGLNARTFVHLEVTQAGDIPARDVQFLTEITEPVDDPPSGQLPGASIPNARAAKAARLADEVFESIVETRVDPQFNRIWIHTWADDDCCLPRGATTADLVGELDLVPGDVLLLEEVKGLGTGLERDADPAHRQVVRLIDVDKTVRDPLMTASSDASHAGAKPITQPTDPELRVTRVRWHPEDSLAFTLCLSKSFDGRRVRGVSVARGNLVLADHGRLVEESHKVDHSAFRYSKAAYRFRLARGPLTYGARWQRPGEARRKNSVASLWRLTPADAEPSVALVDGGGIGLTWAPLADLLGSDPFSRAFVAEPGNDGRGLVRFGDGEFGMQPGDGEDFVVMYRVGNGRSGNIGPDTLKHVIEPAALPAGQSWPTIEGVRNPLPAQGGVDPEPIDKVRQVAPDAFRAETFRAVTAADYERAAEKLIAVSHAAARFRWTGSWYTVFATIDPRGSDEVSKTVETEVRNQLTGYKQAGYDLEIRDPTYVPLEIDIEVCVAPDHYRAHVEAAVRVALSNRRLADGTLAFFHPDRFTFAQPLYLSDLYRAVEAVPGVDSARVTKLLVFAKTAAGELKAARIDVGALEIVRLNNDPSFPEHGVLILDMKAGI